MFAGTIEGEINNVESKNDKASCQDNSKEQPSLTKRFRDINKRRQPSCMWQYEK